MTLIVQEVGTPAYAEASTLLGNLRGFSLNPSTSRRAPTIWTLQGPGENWDDVTEEFQTRPILAVMSLETNSYRGREVSIAVQPAHRGHGNATRLLRWVVLNQYANFDARVSVDQREGMAFAAKHGAFRSYDGDTMMFEFNINDIRLPHLGCSCPDCHRDLDFAVNRRG